MAELEQSRPTNDMKKEMKEDAKKKGSRQGKDDNGQVK